MPDEHSPLPLWRPSGPGSAAGRQGRPPHEPGTYLTYPDPQEFQVAYHRAYIEASQKWHHPTQAQVGGEMEPVLLAERTLRKHLKLHGFPWPPF
jgi:hypothetical protein